MVSTAEQRLSPAAGDEQDPLEIARKGRLRHRKQLWWVLFALAMWSIAASFANLIIGGRVYETGSTGALAKTGLGTFLQSNADYIGAALTLPVLVVNARQRHSNTRYLWVALLPWLVWRFEAFAQDGSLNPKGMNLAVPIVLLAIWSLNIVWEDLEVLGYAIFGLCLFSLLLIPTGKAWSVTSADGGGQAKALIGSRTLAGPFGDMNTLGMSIALGLPFVLMIANRTHRNLALGAAVLVSLLASSRTSLAAIGITVAVSLLLRWAETFALKKVLLTLCVGGIAGTIVYLPLNENDPTAFTTRGAIWIAARKIWPGHFWTGPGLGAFGKDGAISKGAGLTVYHGHNLFVSTMTIGGFLLCLAVALSLVMMVKRALSFAQVSLMPIMATVTLLALCIAEMPWRLDEFSGMGWIGWLIFGVVLLVQDPNRRVDEVEA